MAGEYGAFDDAAREYVIRRPDTPLAWLNHLGQDDLFGLCTNTGEVRLGGREQKR